MYIRNKGFYILLLSKWKATKLNIYSIKKQNADIIPHKQFYNNAFCLKNQLFFKGVLL